MLWMTCCTGDTTEASCQDRAQPQPPPASDRQAPCTQHGTCIPTKGSQTESTKENKQVQAAKKNTTQRTVVGGASEDSKMYYRAPGI